MAKIARDRIARLARRLKLLTWAAVALAAALYAAARLELVLGGVAIVARSAIEAPAFRIAHDVAVVLLLFGLAQLGAMLGLIERGDRFSPAVTRRFRRFALLLFLAAAVTLVAAPLAMLATPAGSRHALQIPLNFRDLWAMLVTGVLFLVARLLDEAQRIEADLREFV